MDNNKSDSQIKSWFLIHCVVYLSVCLSFSVYGQEALTFEQFKVPEVADSPLKKVDFNSHPDGVFVEQKWQWMKASVVGQQANFAGHFYILSTGCGTGCQFNVVVQVETGKIMDTLTSGLGLCYQADSDLLIMNPKLDGFAENVPDWAYTYYYQFEEGKINLLKKDQLGFDGTCDFGQ
ncbi:hypothetical protein Q4574_05090 [Aliiglaciecola sp. 3_MG-2023]|uniref:hypothetical protein n=1 Tax=Aliiglaciecola sp. 3_MG-2023 TaxID=3062644 RepID=UPI0026E1CEB3|nr:hypothetical protein [Aliiglaciecola sp. 3_MG-2023]MDO6692645.1 hypothetical protein [Aliiglaciecola sp. 3_MG-2023]